ncbi:RecQ family ATP-dependent DNA helicase [Naasia lichenicola]|uniref:RecQ family ATP-dependent DNA helicase n=1 Tax=Naasia lichenicola TaxID=2565933 RepID=UPI001E5471ED|nr:RecQ family ATP-dependent DNA helicase [Naasia lichenicola]
MARDPFGWEQLRPGLDTAIAELVAGNDVIAVMPTGYGKSAVYKIAGALLDGPTVVVSPLIALQADQVAGIQARPTAPRAVAINSSQSERRNAEAWAELEARRAEYVFLSPEQLAKDEVVERLAAVAVSLFVVDEAHCVSAWGHDFRPDYLRLRDAVDGISRGGSRPVVLALTATGSAPVREEIVERLGMRDPVMLTHGYDRANIRLDVVRHEGEDEKRRAVIDEIVDLGGPGLLYVATRKATELFAAELSERGLRAAAYHGGLGAKQRKETHERFQADELDVVVATSAFGMGIDKPNVRFVVHAAITESIDSYYQEVGRCGRDGDPAQATLHYRPEDLGLRTFFASGKPNGNRLELVLTALQAADRPVSAEQLGDAVHLPGRSVGEAVNLLLEAGAVRQVDGGLRAVRGVKIGDAIQAARHAAEQRERIDESRIAMIRLYAETLGCRRIFLLGYFGEARDEPCGNCDTCTSGTAYEMLEQEAERAVTSDSAAFTVDQAVRHTEWGDGTVMSVEDDRITVFFGTEGYRVLSLEAITEHHLLEPA